MKYVAAILFFCCALGSWSALAFEPQVRNKEPLPQIEPVVISEPVAVPETIGATLLAGLGFLIMFRRRRYA